MIILQAGKKPIDVARETGHGKIVSLLEKDCSPGVLEQVKMVAMFRTGLRVGSEHLTRNHCVD
jgi:hypothetical protein